MIVMSTDSLQLFTFTEDVIACPASKATFFNPQKELSSAIIQFIGIFGVDIKFTRYCQCPEMLLN